MTFRETTLGLLAGLAFGATAQAADIDHVLLISVDGLHALDVARYIEGHPNSAMAELSSHGITYSNARTPANSDSFPGLLALVTGGSPISHGLFYDVSYNRGIFDPRNTTCSGQPGNMQVFDESIDKYAGNPPVSLNVIDPAALPNRLDENGKCVRLFPHSAVKSNTIFEVAKANGGHTAWADKHPAYDLVNGPSGKGVDDLYTPEITNVGGLDNTVSVVCSVHNDALKVQGILNEIKGLKHDGTPGPGVPAVFGMNFQAVSVGQKLSKENSDGRSRFRPAENRRRSRQHDQGSQGSRHLRLDLVLRKRQARAVANQPGEGQQTRSLRRPRCRFAGCRHQFRRDGHRERERLRHWRLRLRPRRRHSPDLAARPEPDGCGCRLSECKRPSALHR